jgi:hypothetical protein
MNDDGTKKALNIINPGKIYTEVGTKLKEDADARMKAHPEWARPDYFYPDNTLDGVIANLQEQPVAYLTRAFSENAPQLGVQVLLALTTGGVGSMIFMGSSAAGNTYQEAIDSGMPEEEALIVGTVRGSIEAALEGTGLDNLLAKGASRKIGDSFAKHLLKKIGEVTWKATVEGLTEFTQQVVANTIALTYDENRGLLDGAWASGLAGFISGAPTAGVSAILQGSGIDTNVDADTNVSNQNIIPQINGGSSQPEQQVIFPGSSIVGVGVPGVSIIFGDVESTVADAPEASVAAPVQDLISGIAEAEVNAPPTTGFGATQAQPTSRVTDLPRVQIEGANQDGQSFVLNAADLRRIQGEKFITDDGQNLIEAPTNEDALRVLDVRTITDRDSNFVIKYQNTDLSAKELLEQVSPQGFDVVIDRLGRIAASQETLTNLQQLARFQDLKTKSELPTDLRDVIDRYASVRDLTLAGDMVARRLEAQGVDIPKTVAPDGISLGNVDPEQVLTRLAEIQNGAQVSPMRVKLTAEGIFLPRPEDNITAAALRQMGQDVPVNISPTDLLNQVVKQFGYDNLKEYFDVREDVKAFRRGEKSLPSFSKEKGTEGTRISPTQAERIVRRYFGEDEVTVQIAKKILTPAGERAVGSYRGTIITFAENPLESTPTHEVLHAYFDMFTSPSRKEQVLREVMREYNVTDRIEAEEILADEFVEFVRGADSRNWTDIIRNFFGRVWEGIKTLANRQSAVYALYNDIIAKRRPDGVQVSDEVLSNQQMFQVEGDVTLKFFAMPEFTKRKDMLKEEAISLAKSGRAALKANEQNFIINVIEGYFPEAKRISMNDLKKALLTEALPLREMETNEYGNYGLERTGLTDITDEKSVILNTPYQHGWTGHWTDAYGNEQKKLYKTIPGKDGTFLVVDDWVDPTDATSPYSVHKSGTKDEVDTWLAEHQGDKEAINKGLFSHYRVWRGDGYILPFADKVADIIKKHTSANRSFMSFYGFLGSISDSHPMSNLNVNRSSFSPDETEAFLKKTIKALSDKPALEAAYERLNTTAKLFKADDGRLMNLASNWINADEQQNSMFNRAQLFTQWLEKNHPEMDKEASEYLYDRGVRTARSDGYVESIDRVLEQNNPEGLIIKRDFFQAAEILKTQYEQALASQGETPSYDSYIAEIQSDSFQEQKFKRRLGDVGGTMLELQIDDLSKQITEIEKALEDPRDVKIPNEVLASPDRSDLTLTIPETSEAVSKRRSLEFGKSYDHKDRLLILARYKGLVPQWMVDVAKATGTDRDLPFRVFVSSQPGESSFTTSRFGQNKLAPGSKIEISTYEGVKNFSKDYLRGKLEDLKSARADKDQQLVVHKASPDTAIKKQQEKAVNKFFAPFQDTWHERTIRQAIQDEARKGAKTISFPALTTIAKIEGFVSSNEDGANAAFEDVYGGGIDSTFEYGGRSWTTLRAEDGVIEAALEGYVETFDNDDILEIINDNTDSLFEDAKGEFDTIKANFPNIYEEAGAKEFLAVREEAEKIRDLLGSQSALRGTKETLADIEKAIEDAESSSPELELLLVRRNHAEQRISGIEKILKDKGVKPTDEFSVPPKYVGIPTFLEGKTMDMIERIADGELLSEQAVDEQLREDIYDEERDSFYFPSYADNLGWDAFHNEDMSTWLVIKRPMAAERRIFESSDFESNELDDNASEETFAKTYKETLDGDQKGVVYFYDAKVIPYLKKLRKDNLELVEKDGSWWYETKVTPEDTGPVTMFQVDKTADMSLGKPIDQLMTEARQYKTPEEFIKAQQPEKVTFTTATEKASYMSGHEAPMAEEINNPIWDLTGEHTGNDLYPKDIYSFEASRLYSSGSEADPQAIGILHSLKGKPNESVAVYRAVPKDAPSELNPGDWITLTRAYAKGHGESNLKGDFKIVKRTVKARDIFTDANSIQEFGYDPQPRLAPKNTPYNMLSKSLTGASYQRQLTRIWNEANGLTPVTMFQVDKTADQIVAENIVKSTATTKQAINQAIKGTKPEAVLKTEKQLLKASLRAQRRVARSIVKNTQQRLAEQFANKLADIRKVKTYLTEYLKMLPLNERGKMITLVRDAETIFDLAKATNRVNVKMEEVEKREVIAEIRKAYNRILESPGVDVGFKALVSGIFNEIQLQGKSNATMERLAKLREFIQTRTEKGEPVYIQSRLLRQLEILDKTPIKEIPVEQLEAMLSDMELLEDQGRLKKELRYQAYRRQVESIAESVMPELYPVDRPQDIKKTAGQALTGEERMINAATKIKRTKMMTGRAFRTMDVFFDMFSGGKGLYNTQFFTQFKGRIDASFQNYLKAKDDIIDPINKMVQTLGLNEEQLERVGVYAQLKQEGGLDKLIQLGFKQRDLESIKLDAEEMKLYTQMREDFETMYPKMKEYMAHVYNQDIGSVENYFPMVTNWDEMSEIEMAERFGVTQVDSDSLNPMKSGRPKKNVIAGSTIERKRGAQQKIVTNALVAYKRHMDNAIYMLEMGETIRTLSDVTKVEGFKESIGDFGYETIVNYLDLMARKGGKANDSKLAWLDTLRKNASVGVMGAKLSSILVQPSAFANGAADIGTEYAMKGASHLALDEYWRTFAYKNMPELKARVGNDPAFAEIDEDGRFEKFRTLSMKPLQFLDSITAAAIAMGAYEKYMDEHGMEVDFENPNKDALAYAQLKLRKTQGSTFFKDQPPMYSRGDLSGNRSIDRALGAFQSFMLNNWNWLSYDFPERIKRDPKQAVEAASWLLMAQIYTVTAQALSKDILAAIFGGEGEDDPFLERLMASFFSNIPIISQIMSTIEYGSVPVPLVSTGQKIATGFQGIFNETSKPATKAKAAVRAASGVGTLMGIPGSTQAGDIVTRLMTGDK